MRKLACVYGLFCIVGCEMDQKILDVDQRYYETSKVAFAAIGKAAVSWEQTEQSRSSLEIASIESDAGRFLDRHTSPDGRLISLDANGAEKPLLRSDLEQFVHDRDARILTAKLSNERNLQAIAALRDLKSQLDSTADIWMDRKADWVEKRKSMAATLNAALTALSGIGGGIAIGAAAL